MRETLKRFIKLTAGYSLITLLGPLFTIILTPLYTRVLTPADYGVVEVALTLASFCVMIATLGMDQALSAYYFDRTTPEHPRNLVTTAILCATGMSTLFSLIVLMLARPLAVGLFKDVGRIYLMYFLATYILAAPIVSIVTAALRLRMGLKRVNALALISLLITVTTNAVMILGLRLKATGIIAATALTSVLVSSLGLVLVWQPLRGQFDRALAKPLLRAGASLALGTLSLGMLSNVDRLILTQFVHPTDLGLYSIANKLASMAYVILSAGWNAWWPMALEMAGRPDGPRQHARMFELFAAAAMLVALAIGLFAAEILNIFTRAAYIPAAPYTLILLIYTGPMGFIGVFFQLGLYVRKQTYWVSIAYGLAACFNILLNLLLNPLLGVWGAILATLLAGGVWMTILYVVGQRALRAPYRLGRVALLGLVYLALILFFFFTPNLNSVFLKLNLLAGFLIAVFVLGILSPSHVKLGLHAVSRGLFQLTKRGR